MKLTRDGAGRTVATLERLDGVVVELPGYDRKHRVPHDLAHLIAERELGLRDGVFGSIASGGVFDNMRVVGGRPRHDAAERSKRLLDSNKRWLGVAELMADALHDAAESRTPSAAEPDARRYWKAFNTEPYPWPDADLTAAATLLITLADQLRNTGTLHLTWPDHLTKPIPSATPGVRRGRRGRVRGSAWVGPGGGR